MTARRHAWAAAALYSALTLLLTFPLLLTANRTLPSDDPDGHLFMWTLAWDAHAFVHQPLSIFDANIFYPARHSLALSENLIGSAFFAAPVLWLTGNPVLAVNVVSLLSCMLCGLGAYVLGRRLGLSPAAAALTGIIFAFSPPRFFRFSQLHLTAVQWIPFTLASLHAYLDQGRKRDMWLAIGFFTLQVLASGHGGVFALVAILLLLAYRFALGEPIRLERRVRDVGAFGALLLAPAVLLLIPYRMNQVEVGLRRVLDTSGTPIESFFASPTRVDVFLQSLITDRNINGAAIAWLFPGFLPVLLALTAVVAGCAALFTGPRALFKRPRALFKRPRALFKRPPAAPFSRLARVVFAAAVLAWALVGAAPSVLRAGDGLAAQSYGSDTMAWTGYLNVEQAGRYNFGTTSDEASRLTIDDTSIIDRRSDHPEDPKTGSLLLDPGSHRILVEHSQPGERTAPDLLWTREGDGQPYQPVPSWALSRRPTRSSMVRIVRALESVRAASAIVAGLAIAWWLCASLVSRREAWTTWGDRYRRSPTACYLLLTLICMSLASGASGLWRFVYWLPGFNFIRGPSRFMILGVLGIAVLAGVGFDRVAERLAPARRRLAAVVAAALLLAEFSAIPYRGVPYQLTIPAADLWVAERQKPFSVAEVPVTRSERYQSNYMLHSMAHWQKTVHGFSGIVPPLHEVLYDQLRSFPSEDSLRQLAQLGVTYVIVHGSWFPPDERSAVEARLPAFGSWLTLEYTDADSRVYSIHSPP